MLRGEGGQATVEWSALMLLVALALAVGGYAVARGDAIRLADDVAGAIVCAISNGCPGSLERAYGDELADTVRRFAPNVVYERSSRALPIDFRRCRETSCSDGDVAAEEIGESEAGLPVTAFTRVVDRRPTGGALYIQYWLYFPESFSGGIGRHLGPLADRWPGFHPDDWEGVQLRIDRGGVAARATAHGRYKNLKHSEGWGRWTGWYRVSGGSHAGHLVSGPTGERVTRASELGLVPLESLSSTDRYSFEVTPPWRKAVYSHPEAVSA